MLSSKIIGEKIKFRRQDIGMSQERLAELIGVSFQQVQRYENGRNKISVERIQQIAEALSVQVANFFADGSAPIISELGEEYTPSSEEKTLLKYFGRVSGKAARQFVITAARLAAKG
ncbi:MAG: helix-turn-helix domain-containing protein [Geobacteraceae bacterium]|nr:helix-turn-helix domain-containing protein [Geobacteraceae bacterium]